MVEVPGARVPESGDTDITSLQRGVVFVFHLARRVCYVGQGKLLTAVTSTGTKCIVSVVLVGVQNVLCQ